MISVIRYFCRPPGILLASILLSAVSPLMALDDQGYWVDPGTHFMWTAADNGVGLSLRQAAHYCRQLRLGGFQDWTLPSIDDLQGLMGDTQNQKGYRIKAPIKLTGWQWSSSAGRQEGEAWVLDFGDGARASVPAGDSGLNRALCVRQTAK
jgi:hypothetical protein